MLVAMHQPHCFPWLGFFHKMANCDLFVLLDDVQYVRKEWQNRNFVKTHHGKQLLTVPIIRQTPEATIAEKRIDNHRDWRRKQWRTIQTAYSKAGYWGEHEEFIHRVTLNNWTFLLDISIEVITYCRSHFGIATPLIRSSSLSNINGTKTDRLVSICRSVGASRFLCGVGARTYLEAEKFADCAIALEWQSFVHPTYYQLHMHQGFLQGMWCLDLLLNHGPKSVDVLSGQYVPSEGNAQQNFT